MPKLLIIEDDPHIAEIVQRFASQHDYEPFWAEDGEAGLALARVEQPEVLLIDIMLPKLDGRDVLSRLQGEAWLRRSVVFFLTARDQQYDRLVGLELGADDYIGKPVIMEHLFAKIAYMLAKKRQPTEV